MQLPVPQEGDRVTKGQVICIIEAMKVRSRLCHAGTAA